MSQHDATDPAAGTGATSAPTTRGSGILDRRIHPAHIYPPYKSTQKRGPTQPLIPLARVLRDDGAPVYGETSVDAVDADLTRNARTDGEPIGERIVVKGRVLDERGRPIRNSLVEVWQANAAGRYIHVKDVHDAPLDPNFAGGGRCLTNGDGEFFFTTIKPGAYPWKNHPNAWRPSHIHFSVFGRDFHSRLITQMYFPGDPLLALDPIYQGIPDVAARKRLVSHYDHDLTQPGWALGFTFDIVVAGSLQTPFEEAH